MITREWLEQKQIWLYVIALVLGGFIGIMIPEMGSSLYSAISPLLAILLFGMFTQIPFLQWRGSVLPPRFVFALLTVNFLIVPVVVWLLTRAFPQPSNVLVGILLVLLTPCIDYVIVFTQLGRGNERFMLAATPILFVVQMALLPFYLWLFLGSGVTGLVKAAPFAEAFVLLIVLPLLVAIAVQLWAKRKPSGGALLAASAWLPVPLMALVLITVVASQIGKIMDDHAILLKVLPLYAVFHIVMPILSRVVGAWFRLDSSAGRAVVFSASTRNSLVVLPLALALPDEWAALTAAVIVTQTLLELVAELIYIRAVPLLIWRDDHASSNKPA